MSKQQNISSQVLANPERYHLESTLMGHHVSRENQSVVAYSRVPETTAESWRATNENSSATFTLSLCFLWWEFVPAFTRPFFCPKPLRSSHSQDTRGSVTLLSSRKRKPRKWLTHCARCIQTILQGTGFCTLPQCSLSIPS